ncbi:hypothetical protein SUGI_1089000 [Cryptomeria japonica]|nr:hypothetical protein SUGI_1089000 [Cryptomeria japonica]
MRQYIRILLKNPNIHNDIINCLCNKPIPIFHGVLADGMHWGSNRVKLGSLGGQSAPSPEPIEIRALESKELLQLY